MAFPYQCTLDDVRLSYSKRQGKYRLNFRKTVKNVSDQPLGRFYVRLKTCAFPDNPSLAEAVARRHPLDLGVIGFEAASNGEPLDWQVLHQSDTDVELYLLFASLCTREPSAIQPGEERCFSYSFNIRHDQWGPYLQRRTRCPTDRLRVELKFPLQLVKMTGFHEGLNGSHAKINKAIRHKKQGRYDVFTYEAAQPIPSTRYRFEWRFLKHQKSAIESEAARLIGDSDLVHHDRRTQLRFSTDFRSAAWQGDCYVFSGKQAKVVEILWQHWLNDLPVISWQELAKHAGVKASRFHVLFGTHPAAGKLIVSAGRMAWRLRPPTLNESKHSPSA